VFISKESLPKRFFSIEGSTLVSVSAQLTD